MLIIKTFLNKMFVQFFACVSPVSSVANPRCIKKTRKAHIRIQVLFIMNEEVALPSSIKASYLALGEVSSAAAGGGAASCDIILLTGINIAAIMKSTLDKVLVNVFFVLLIFIICSKDCRLNRYASEKNESVPYGSAAIAY